MMKLYRCYGCDDKKGQPGLDFESDTPVCPNCGADPRSDPRDATIVIELANIHFEPPHPKRKGRGCGHLACDPKKSVPCGESTKFTGEPSAVTCKRCRESDVWKQQAGDGEPPPIVKEADKPVSVSPEGISEDPEPERA